MYVYIYIYIYTCMYIHYIYIYISINTYIYNVRRLVPSPLARSPRLPHGTPGRPPPRAPRGAGL